MDKRVWVIFFAIVGILSLSYNNCGKPPAGGQSQSSSERTLFTDINSPGTQGTNTGNPLYHPRHRLSEPGYADRLTFREIIDAACSVIHFYYPEVDVLSCILEVFDTKLEKKEFGLQKNKFAKYGDINFAHEKGDIQFQSTETAMDCARAILVSNNDPACDTDPTHDDCRDPRVKKAYNPEGEPTRFKEIHRLFSNKETKESCESLY